jgi:alpha-tubulin suppressor-like RCC1 family protein
VFETHTGRAFRAPVSGQRPDVVCRSRFATRRVASHGNEEPLSRIDTTRSVRGDWLKTAAHPSNSRYSAAEPASAAGAHSSVVVERQRSILDVCPPKVLQVVLSLLDLPSLARVEASATDWRAPLAAAVGALLARTTERRATLAPCLRGAVSVDRRRAPRKFRESWARALRFALSAEGRKADPLRAAPLGRGPGAFHSLVLNSLADGPDSGRLMAFGWGKFGQTGLRTLQPQALPAYVEPFAEEEPRRILDVAVGQTHSLCADEDGVVWSMGEDDRLFRTCTTPGGYDDMNVRRVTEPRPVMFPPPVVADTRAASYRGVGAAEGTRGRALQCEARGYSPYCGSPPHLLAGAVRVLSVSAGTRFSVCLDDTGAVWTWGCAIWGCLGHGTDRRDEPTPRRIEAFGASLEAQRAQAPHGITDGARANFHRRGARGQSSLPGDANSSGPTANQQGSAAPGSGRVVAICAGSRHCLAIDRAGALYTWGYARDGALGLGDAVQRNSPMVVDQISGGRQGGVDAIAAAAIAAGGRHSLVVTTDGRLLSCGNNENGQLGRQATQSNDPASGARKKKFWGDTSLEVYSGPPLTGDRLYGKGKIGELNDFADAHFGTVPLPTPRVRSRWAVGRHGESAASASGDQNLWSNCAAGGMHSLALRADGSVWSWGQNTFGQLGLGEHYDAMNSAANDGARSSYTTRTTARAVTAIQPLAAMGLAPDRELGPVGGRPIRPDVVKPCQVLALRGLRVIYIAAGAAHSLFQAESGSVQACGQGGQGQLGVLHKQLVVGDISDRSTPEVIDALGKDEDV